MSVIIYVLAFVIDLMLGDPQNWPHPVRWIGNAIHYTERRLRDACSGQGRLQVAGLILWVVIVFGSYIVTYSIVQFCSGIHWLLGSLVELWLAYTVLATRCLSDCAKQVFDALCTGDIAESRRQLSYIVGRDTSQLNRIQITKAVIETVAENTVDGVIAPLFYLFIGGVPLAMAYKAVNTLDSMVGYKNEKYAEMGYFSAKLDDVANYIPARLSWLVFSLAAKLTGGDSMNALKIGWRDRKNHKSPNCAWPEGTVAGALGVRLGGPNVYFGQLVDKPWIGDEVREVNPQDILISIRMMYVAASVTVVLFCLMYWV
ncbi:adenosylcobinamide-phosphate synthase CbiB [Vibrio salinus]|uniref:adenosylcobinamide-phosphate synthase CbiB n=1 Tax=Vibrio salinus TaxID=2899784 RepID=UPI001E422214|nr:adenosylcobinamide-phosphate synthase CbiB [Vibrio salinus]MCE0495663.1 adenosylcobinamide-phosphate synthase CbiB [Vibrio salinus]